MVEGPEVDWFNRIGINMSPTEFEAVTALFDVKASAGTVDLKFKNVPLAQLAEFLAWQGSEAGLQAIGESLVNALIANGVFTAEQIASGIA